MYVYKSTFQNAQVNICLENFYGNWNKQIKEPVHANPIIGTNENKKKLRACVHTCNG